MSENSNQQNQPTIVSLYDIDDLSAHHCGYCNQNGNISIGMSSDLMQIQDYQLLIDRGWRRSGTYLYKPVMNKTCCPLYTIKSDATKIVLKKSQKNVLNTMKKYLEKGEKNKEASQDSKGKNETENSPRSSETKSKKPNVSSITSQKPSAPKETHAKLVIKYILENNEINSDKQPNELLNIPKLKSKHKRLFKKLLRLKKNNQIKESKDVEKFLKKRKNQQDTSLESYLKLSNQTKNKLTVKLVRSWPPSKEFHETLNEVHSVYARYQTTIHKDSPLECNMRQFQRFLCTSPLMPLSYKSGPLSEPAKLNTSNLDEDLLKDVANLGYGSFHQQYRINGKLIGVGVIDILNRCVSSVYFFYDPDYNFLNLGTYSALREIYLTRQLNKLDPAINSYYLGFYVHSCRKMRYKGQFIPSYLACPETFTWHKIEKCIELIEKNKYSRFSLPNVTESDQFTDLSEVRIRAKFRDSEAKIFTFKEFCRFLNKDFVPQFAHLVSGYCRLFGREFSKRVLIKF